MGLKDALDKATEFAVDTAKAVDPDKIADAVSGVARSAATAAKAIDIDQVGNAVKNAIGSAADSVDSVFEHDKHDGFKAAGKHIAVTVEYKGDGSDATAQNVTVDEVAPGKTAGDVIDECKTEEKAAAKTKQSAKQAVDHAPGSESAKKAAKDAE